MDAAGLIASILRRPLDGVGADAPLAEIPGWDSILMVRLMLSLEERKGRELTAREMEGVVRLSDVDRLLDPSS